MLQILSTASREAVFFIPGKSSARHIIKLTFSDQGAGSIRGGK
ncbi:hypothetical protein A678_04529 [Salmonella enterica subsp. enterica serovar Enteritidis str. 2010K-0271]|nr:hypothetical protein A679_04951 [Salmonella enterica subsp. enterica serovar Enteritidis str. 2010K-0284]EPI93848.1 hypothetical protein A678_04529 [Salmonella enterica subsp. enterica serovar Enteritidis str. 2010K-0271]EPI94982.1 hypothetical protein A677_04607 [Salmonella enterica subsp. enterica serovar Enteritidis str. 2010K-0267]EPJ08896.1 hypothetical protein A680_04060 [Salmonella enterica subsp. enterica serovar Enteritidis str. 2010K-0286]